MQLIIYKLSVIVFYVPTEDTVEGAKDTFYEKLEEAVEEKPSQCHDVLLIPGDLNANVGSDNQVI